MKISNISNNWFIDKESRYKWIYHMVKRHVLSVKTSFQQVEIFDTYNFGRIVILDIDEEFIHLCKKYLKKWHCGSFDDDRVELIFADAKEYIKGTRALFDVIIADISDPDEKGPARMLYTKNFYSSVRAALKPDGIFVTHATEVHYTLKRSISTEVFKKLSEIFPVSDFYYEFIPSFSSPWAFTVGSLKYSPKKMSPDTVNKRLKKRGLDRLSYYDKETHKRLFSLPKILNKLL